MEKQILQEIRQLKAAFAKLIGSTETKETFSIEALDKAAIAFQKLSIERGEWLDESGLSKLFKGTHYGAGAFIRNEFSFSNYFKRGHTYYYHKGDITKLSKELSERKIDLGQIYGAKRRPGEIQKLSGPSKEE